MVLIERIVMLVNYMQISYALGITVLEAKAKMAPHLGKCVDVFKNKGCDSMRDIIKLINKEDVVESAALNERFNHPSMKIDGKDRIEYTINSLKRGEGLALLTKKIVEDMSCLKAGKIAGKYRPLLYILTKEDIDSINSVIRKKRKEYLYFGGVFKTEKANSKR